MEPSPRRGGGSPNQGGERPAEPAALNPYGFATMTSIANRETTRSGAAGEPAARSAIGFLGWLMSPQRRGPLLIAPAIITLFLVNIFPLMWSFGLSFFAYKANRLAAPVFKGLDNYAAVLNDPEIWARFQNTAVLVIGT